MAPVITRVRIANPHKRRRKAKRHAHRSAARRRNTHRRPRVKARRHRARVKVRKHRNPRGGELTLMTKNPHKKRRHRRSKKNPFFSAGKKRRHRSRGRSRRHRNPSSVAGVRLDPVAIATMGIAGTAGAIGTRSLTQLVLQEKNTGWMGYGANLLTAVLLGFGVKKLTGKGNIAAAVFTGSLVGIGLRIWSEQVSKTSAAALSGLGDVDFSDNGLGAYVDTTFPVPTISVPGANGYLTVAPNPAGGSSPAPAAPAAGANAVPVRYASRF